MAEDKGFERGAPLALYSTCSHMPTGCGEGMVAAEEPAK